MTGGIEGPMSDSTDKLGILIVDDDPDQIFLSQRLVEKSDLGFSVATADGGPEAVAYLTQACDGACAIPVLIFLDIRMPEMDGFDVLRWIRTKDELSQVRVIILSSSDDPKDAKQASELGADGYLIKDPNPMVVASILRQVSTNRVRCPLKLSTTE
jgi:CheY-like chemotaxis protein